VSTGGSPKEKTTFFLDSIYIFKIVSRLPDFSRGRVDELDAESKWASFDLLTNCLLHQQFLQHKQQQIVAKRTVPKEKETAS